MPADERQRVLLVTTHSVEDSGLLDVLAPAFQEAHPELRLTTTSVGSGAALTLGRRGDADLLLTHDPDGEAEFMAEGYGVERGLVMVNEFLLVGPAPDPARVRGTGDVVSAFAAVARTESRFLSRGDDSGTHRRERSLWRAAGLEPWIDRPGWYVEAGLGMAETLQTGSELRAYLLTDEATYQHLQGTIQLEVLSRGDPRLRNPYSYIIPVRPVNPEGARALADWLVGAPVQALIAEYGVAELGAPLFQPGAAAGGSADPPDGG